MSQTKGVMKCCSVTEFPEEAVEKLFSVRCIRGQNEPRGIPMFRWEECANKDVRYGKG